ncbi:reverse transcriptase domain-containing protein [Tanacetum coccineum]
MAAPVISISSDLSVESVGSSFSRVILIGSISVEVSVAPEVGAAAVTSPAGVLELDTHSSLEADPSKSSLPLVFVAPLIPTSPIPPAPRAVVAPSTNIISPVDAPPENHRRQAILIRPGHDIPIDRLYHTHPGGPCRALTAKKSVRPLPSHHLALRYTSHHFDRFTSGSSSGHSSSDHSSFGHSILSHSLSGHTPPETIIADSSVLLRFVYPPLARTLGYSEAYRCWRSALLSNVYPPTTSESSAGDSSSKSSVRPSRKRCRSPATTVTTSIHALRALVPSRADLLLPRKRFRDSISPEDSVKKDINTDVLADIKADVMAVEVAADMDVKAEVDAGIGMEVDVGVDVEDEVEGEVESSYRGTMEAGVDVVVGIDIPDGMLMPDAMEHLEQVEEVVHDIYRHGIKIPLQRVAYIETGHRRLEVESLIVDGERASLLDQVASLERSNIMTITRSGMTPEPIEELINQRVAEALAAYEANRVAELVVESQSQNGDDDDNGNVREMETEMETEMVEEMETEIEEAMGMEIPIAMIENAHKRIIGADAAFSMSWRELMKLMTEMVPEEEDRVEKFIGGFPDNIQGNVIDAEPTRLQDVIRIANNLMDQKLKGYAVKNAENKRRKCNKVGHMTRDCMNVVATTATQRALVANQRVPTCFECGRQGHYRNECPKLKNQTRGNKAGKKTNNARRKAYVLGGGEANPESNAPIGVSCRLPLVLYSMLPPLR